MATIVNPSGTPTIIYNRSGTTIVTVTPTGNNSQAGAAAIPRSSGRTVALCAPSAGQNSVIMPSDAEVGDIVEVYTTSNATNLNVFPQSGGSLGLAGANASIPLQDSGRFLRYIGSSNWVVLGSFAT